MDKKVNRSSKTGKFVTPKYAKKHKATTETERVKPKAKIDIVIELLEKIIRMQTPIITGKQVQQMLDRKYSSRRLS